MTCSFLGSNPMLVTLEGDEVDRELFVNAINQYRVSPADVRLLQKGFLTPEEENYFDNKYGTAELLGGFWGSLTKIAKGIPLVGTAISVGEGIADVVRGKGKDSGSSDADLLRLQLEEQRKKNEQTQKILMYGLPAAALIVFALMRK